MIQLLRAVRQQGREYLMPGGRWEHGESFIYFLAVVLTSIQIVRRMPDFDVSTLVFLPILGGWLALGGLIGVLVGFVAIWAHRRVRSIATRLTPR